MHFHLQCSASCVTQNACFTVAFKSWIYIYSLRHPNIATASRNCRDCLERKKEDNPVCEWSGAQKESEDSERILSNYIFGWTLGSGAFAKVKLAQHVLTGHQVAVKILKRKSMTNEEIEKVMREVKILRRLVHPHIIRLLEVIETKSRIFVVMEYMDHGELYDYIMQKRKIEENQIISGIEFCHLNMVVHRDLKPENLLLDSNHNIKIADFGFSNFMRDGHFLKTSCGSPNYAAPEIVSGQPYAGPEVDVWSCGVILYALLCGELPFDADNIFTLFKTIKNGVYTLPNNLSFGARDMIHRILVVDPMKRIAIPEICRHPCFQNHLPRHLVTPAVEAIEGDKKECVYASPHMGDPMSSITVHNLQKERYMGQQVFPRRQDSTDNRKWMLGLQFQGTPKEIMKEVLRAFQRMNVCWKILEPYSVRCWWLPISPTQMNGTSSDEPAAQATYGAC